jgi:CRISPR/Cas system-associated exonuclease Cas4 (RecB family)
MNAKGGNGLRLSESAVKMYLNCPMSYRLGHVEKVRSKLDYPRVVGSQVHRFIAKMYTSENNPLYYRDLDSARRAWFFNWFRNLEEVGSIMTFRTKKDDQSFGITGWNCVANYWRQNINKPRPFQVERHYEVPILGGVRFFGVLDQVRQISLEAVKVIRPELIQDSRLIKGYMPFVIVDLKTGNGSFDTAALPSSASDQEIAAYQFELHDDLQVTSYWWLYHKVTGAMPVGFYWYHLRDRKYFLTYRTEEDYGTLFETIKHVVDGINTESYPKNIGPHCKRCDFYETCMTIERSRPLLVSQPVEDIGTDNSISTVGLGKKLEKPRQLRLKFKVKRVKKEKKKKEPASQ